MQRYGSRLTLLPDSRRTFVLCALRHVSEPTKAVNAAMTSYGAPSAPGQRFGTKRPTSGYQYATPSCSIPGLTREDGPQPPLRGWSAFPPFFRVCTFLVPERICKHRLVFVMDDMWQLCPPEGNTLHEESGDMTRRQMTKCCVSSLNPWKHKLSKTASPGWYNRAHYVSYVRNRDGGEPETADT